MESVCWSCHKKSCHECPCAVMEDWVDTNLMRMAAKNQDDCDRFIERIYREMTDIAWDEDPQGNLVLSHRYRGFPVGEFTQDDWFHWIDNHHSKGVGWVFENVRCM